MRGKEGRGSTQAEVQGQALNKTQPLGLHDEVALQRQTKAANERESLSCSIEEEGEDEKTKEEEEANPQHDIERPHFLVPSWRLLRLLRDPLRKEGGGRFNKRRTPQPRRTGYYTKETRGLYRQVFQPPFHWPTSLDQLCSCASKDLLCLYVGLCNVLVLQFILVVLVFFAEEELNAETFQHSSRASSNARGHAW